MPPSLFCPDTTWTGTQILLSEQHCRLSTGPFVLFGGEGGMIRHCVAHPFGAACGRSSQQAALLEPGEGSHPPLRDELMTLPQSKKPTIRSVFCNLAVREGFEPSIRCRIHTFQACSFSHSDTSPNFHCLKWLSEHAARASCRLRRWAATRTPHPILVCALTCSANTNSLRRCAGTGRNVRDRREAVNAIFYLLPLFAQ